MCGTLSQGQAVNLFNKNYALSNDVILCLLDGKGRCHKGGV